MIVIIENYQKLSNISYDNDYYRLYAIGRNDYMTVTKQVAGLDGDSQSLSSYNTNMDDRNKLGYQLARRSFRIVLTLVFIGIAVLMGIIGVNGVFIYDYSQIVTDPQYLLLPSDSTFSLPVNPSLYSAINFSFTNTTVEDEITVHFRLTSRNLKDSEESVFEIKETKCDLKLANYKCFITRYWPTGMNVSSNTSCYTKLFEGEDKKNYLVWQWFPFKLSKNRNTQDFNFECPPVDRLSFYHECDRDELDVKKVLDTRVGTDSIVAMRFCTNKVTGSDEVEYRVQFNEAGLKFTGHYNQYTMTMSTSDDVRRKDVTVPLTSTNDDHIIYIVVNGSSTKPVKIRAANFSSVSRMLDNEVCWCYCSQYSHVYVTYCYNYCV